MPPLSSTRVRWTRRRSPSLPRRPGQSAFISPTPRRLSVTPSRLPRPPSFRACSAVDAVVGTAAGRRAGPEGAAPAPCPAVAAGGVPAAAAHPPRMSTEPDVDGFREVHSRRRWRRTTAPRRPVPASLVGKCFNCLVESHVKAQCTFPSRCFRCHEEGHHERHCPSRGSRIGKRGRSPGLGLGPWAVSMGAAAVFLVVPPRPTPSRHARRLRGGHHPCLLSASPPPRSRLLPPCWWMGCLT
jgi:hypothetical protein